MLTLNQIRKELTNWFEQHAQIRTVVSLDDWEEQANRDTQYPLANVEHVLSAIDDKFMNYSFQIKVVSLTGDNVDLQHEAISDATLIADDFFSYLQEAPGWVFRRSSTLDNVIDQGADRYSGVKFRIILGVMRSHNTCIIPKKDNG